MKKIKRDYTVLTQVAKHCGMVPYRNRIGHIVEGLYTLEGQEASVDLSACAEDEKSILKTALRQLSERCDDAYHNAIERDLQD